MLSFDDPTTIGNISQPFKGGSPGILVNKVSLVHQENVRIGQLSKNRVTDIFVTGPGPHRF